MVVSAVMLLGVTTAQAQFGNLVGNLKKVKETVDDVNKKRNGDIEFTKGGNVMGFFRTRTGEFIFDKTHPDGERKGKKVIFKVEKNGDVMYDDGRKIGEVLNDGTVNFHGEQGYLRVQNDGSVVMDGEKVAMINDNGQVYIYDVLIGTAKGLDKKYAALLYLGIYHNKESLSKAKLELAEVKRKQEAEVKRQQEQAAQRRAQAAQNASKSGGSQNNTQKKVREYTIEKGSARGYVDENGVVYNWAHKKLGQLPKGSSGDITDDTGRKIGSVWSGDIKDSSGNLLCHVTSGGSISVKGSNATVAEVMANGRIDMSKDSKTLGYCQCNNHVWTAAIIFCNLFKF
jgi:hypothetical protein